jgi:hypothetical protein
MDPLTQEHGHIDKRAKIKPDNEDQARTEAGRKATVGDHKNEAK